MYFEDLFIIQITTRLWIGDILQTWLISTFFGPNVYSSHINFEWTEIIL